MFKLALIFESEGYPNHEDYFFSTKKEATKMKEFYNRVNPFVDSNNRPTPIKSSYIMRVNA